MQLLEQIGREQYRALRTHLRRQPPFFPPRPVAQRVQWLESAGISDPKILNAAGIEDPDAFFDAFLVAAGERYVMVAGERKLGLSLVLDRLLDDAESDDNFPADARATFERILAKTSVPADIDLKGKQAQALQEALIGAYPDYRTLHRGLPFEPDKALATAATSAAAMPAAVSALLAYAQANGWVSELLAAVIKQNPDDPQLKKLSLEVAMTSTAPPSPGLEAIVLGAAKAEDPDAVPFQNVADWRTRMEQAERKVCRVEIPRDYGVGTGFLVAPDIIMTNWHVARMITGDPSASGIRFDYKADSAGNIAPGEFFPFASPYGLLAKSDIKELDFALLRVGGRPGDSRGYIVPADYEFKVDLPLFILQHPEGRPLQLQAGAITAVNSLFHRISYTTNTEPGSSGSPCFTLGWDAVAIHHQGEAENNSGIPLSAIRKYVSETPALAALKNELAW